MVRELSLGERMKMELIAALLHSPRVLFLDEPTIGLDVVSQKKVREFLRDYNREHQIVTMLTSHYMQDIEELCQRVIIIDHGRIFFDGPLDDIIDRFAGYKILSLIFADRRGAGFRGSRRSGRADAGLGAVEGAASEGDGNVPASPGQLPGDRHQCAGIAGGRSDPPAFRRALLLERKRHHYAAGGGRPLNTPAGQLDLVRVARVYLETDFRHRVQLHLFKERHAFHEAGRHQAVKSIRDVLRFHAGSILNLRSGNSFGESDGANNRHFPAC